MRSQRTMKTLSVLASAGLLVGAFAAGPADAAKKKKKKLVCDAFTPGVEDAAEAEVVKITPKATEEEPVVIEFEHGASIPEVAPDHQYFNIQVYSSTPTAGLWIKDEFSERHDIDLYLFDAAGEEVARSAGFNTLPESGADSDGNATTNSEQIPGYPAGQCEGYTIESRGYGTPGTDTTLSIWLGEETEDYSTP